MGILDWLFGGTKDYMKELDRAQTRLLEAAHNDAMARRYGYTDSKTAQKLVTDIVAWKRQLESLIKAMQSDEEAKKQGYRHKYEAVKLYRDFTKRLDSLLKKI